MKRIAIALAVIAGMLLAGCASVPADPNLAALAASDERRQANDAAHAEALADQRASAVAECARSAAVESCMLGLVAVEAVAARGAQQNATSALAGYRPPPTRLQQFAQVAGAVGGVLGPLASGYVTIETNREAQRTSRAIAELNAGRELGIVQAIAGLGSDIASQPPGVYVGGNYGDTAIDNSQHGDTISDSGNVTDSNNGDHSGRDIVGRDVIDNSGNYGDDNRQDSPGPIDDDSGDCRDGSCNPTEQPEG